MLVLLTQTIELADDGLDQVIINQGTIVYMDVATHIAFHSETHFELEPGQYNYLVSQKENNSISQ